MIANINHQQPVIFNSQCITVETLLTAHQHATSITLELCTSTSWYNIGKALASLKRLQTLTLVHCNIDDVICQELPKSKSLLQLRSGTYCSMQTIAV